MIEIVDGGVNSTCPQRKCENDDVSHTNQDSRLAFEQWSSKKCRLVLFALLSIFDVISDWWLIESWILDGHIWYSTILVTSILVSGLIVFKLNINPLEESFLRRYFFTLPLHLIGLGSTIPLLKTLTGNSNEGDCNYYTDYIMAKKVEGRLKLVPILLVTGYTIALCINEEVTMLNFRMVIWVSYFFSVLTFTDYVMITERFNIHHKFKKTLTAVDFYLEAIGVISEVHMRVFVPGLFVVFFKPDFVLGFFVLFWFVPCVIHVRSDVKKLFAIGNPSLLTLIFLWCITMVSYQVSESGEPYFENGLMRYRGMLQNILYVIVFLWSKMISNFTFTSNQAICVFYSLCAAFILQILQYQPKSNNFEYNRGVVNGLTLQRKMEENFDLNISGTSNVDLTDIRSKNPLGSVKYTERNVSPSSYAILPEFPSTLESSSEVIDDIHGTKRCFSPVCNDGITVVS